MECSLLPLTFLSPYHQQQPTIETGQIIWVAVVTVAILIFCQNQLYFITAQNSATSVRFFTINWLSTSAQKWFSAMNTSFFALLLRGLLFSKVHALWHVFSLHTNRWLISTGICVNNAVRLRRGLTRKDSEAPRTTNCISGSPGDEDESTSPYCTQLWKFQSWILYTGDFKFLLPYLIPDESQLLRGRIYICIACLAAQRIMVISFPATLGRITDSLIARQMPCSDLAKAVLYPALSESVFPLILGLASLDIEQSSQFKLIISVFPQLVKTGGKLQAQQDSTEARRPVDDVETTTNVLRVGLLEILPQVIDLCISFAFLYAKFRKSIALCMTVICLSYFAADLVTSNGNIENYETLLKHSRNVQRVVSRAVEGRRNVFAFDKLAYEEDRLAKAYKKYQNAYRKWSVQNMWASFGILSLFLSIASSLLCLLVVYEICMGRASPGDFLVFWQYWDRLTSPLKYTSYSCRQISQGIPSLKFLVDIIATAATDRNKEGGPALRDVKGHVEFSNVNYSYGNTLVLRDINISVAPGQLIIIVGTTGAGKSTLFRLLLREYDVESGAIYIDGQNIKSVTKRSLGDTVGVVRQDPKLFEETIRENLEYANPLASLEEIERACSIAALHDDILSFPEGYSTNVGEYGGNLSGGQLQRTALAQGLVRRWPIFGVDEPTSAVDLKTAAAIQNALVRERKGKTTFVIAHELHNIAPVADLIVVMDKGAIVERGTHEELLRQTGMYADFWNQETGQPPSERKSSTSLRCPLECGRPRLNLEC